MERMTESRWREFVLTGTRTGKLGVVRADGRPHVTPVWFLLDDSDVLFTTWGDSIKGKALRRDGRFSLCVDDGRPPYDYVMIAGTATLIEDPVQMRTWATRIGGRYMGADRADEYGRRNSVPGEYLVRGAIHQVTAFSGVAD